MNKYKKVKTNQKIVMKYKMKILTNNKIWNAFKIKMMKKLIKKSIKMDKLNNNKIIVIVNKWIKWMKIFYRKAKRQDIKIPNDHPH